ncbi:MAG: hypothetical protein AVDCRST_MAG49-2544 [uncultured Thermomicrobiales bacterium]|uniref:Uncharacterized protein n=1 Tax=uncultured Thermomicrobiales bacterium TaxID=1645740 RepID=A0A6J4UV61_9BACT|nr:MAG: hypothetical protein AVDCRST_MAG49-2544 [uncultured Thermomicrobiales bacterium]
MNTVRVSDRRMTTECRGPETTVSGPCRDDDCCPPGGDGTCC